MPEKSHYDPDFCQVAEEMGNAGYGVAAIASTIGVSKSTLKRWEVQHREFFEAMSQAFKNDILRKLLRRNFKRRFEFLASAKGRQAHNG